MRKRSVVVTLRRAARQEPAKARASGSSWQFQFDTSRAIRRAPSVRGCTQRQSPCGASASSSFAVPANAALERGLMASPSLFGALPLGFVAAMDTLDALPAEHAATLVRRAAGTRCRSPWTCADAARAAAAQARNALEVVARAAPRAAPAQVFQARARRSAARVGARGANPLTLLCGGAQALLNADAAAGTSAAALESASFALEHVYRRASPRAGDALLGVSLMPPRPAAGPPPRRRPRALHLATRLPLSSRQAWRSSGRQAASVLPALTRRHLRRQRGTRGHP